MFHIENYKVRSLLLDGYFGLEKESLRILCDGRMSHTRHPFPENEHIVRDFCENQTEINTSVTKSAEEAVGELWKYTCEIQRKISMLQEKELLWPFSNPPYIKNEADIPIANFGGLLSSKTDYREYLSDRYGRYKMALSGIHVNYSFSDELLAEEFNVPLDSGEWTPVPMTCLQGYEKDELKYQGIIHGNEYIYNPNDLKYLYLDFAEL